MRDTVVVVVGGGITGLTVAYALAREGTEVSLIERDDVVGGLGAGFKVNGAWLEKYYHHLFSGDTNIRSLLAELDLLDTLTWRRTKMGMYCDGHLYPFGSPMDVLRFSPLGLIDRARLGATILSMKRTSGSRELDAISAQEWLLRKGGRDSYGKIWEPMLKVKFGDKFDRASAAWLLGRIRPRAGSRTRFARGEVLGYLKGGFQPLFETLANRIVGNGGHVTTGTPVTTIRTETHRVRGVVCGGSSLPSDSVVFTGSVPQFLKCCDLPEPYAGRLGQIGYRAVMCLVLQLRSPLSEYYWINIADSSLVLGGVIEHTNLSPPSRYGGRTIAYLFSYLEPQDPLWVADDRQVRAVYLKDLMRMFPSFDQGHILRSDLYRDTYATPVFETGFAEKMPGFATPVSGLYLCGNCQVYPLDRSMDSSVRVAREFVDFFGRESA